MFKHRVLEDLLRFYKGRLLAGKRIFFTNMTHFICTGDCGGKSDTLGVCKDEDCLKSGDALKECSCEDNSHNEAGETAEDATEEKDEEEA